MLFLVDDGFKQLFQFKTTIFKLRQVHLETVYPNHAFLISVFEGKGEKCFFAGRKTEVTLGL